MSRRIICQAVIFLLVFGILLAFPMTGASQTGSPLAGQTWVRLGGPLGGLGYDIRMRPDNPDIMYVTDAWAGVHKSTDAGRTWTPLNQGIDLRTGPSGDAIPVFCLTIDPNDYDILWIGLQNLGAIYRSEDGGQTWQRRTSGIVEGEGLTFRGLAVEPGNSDIVYAAGEIDGWRWAGRNMWGREFDRVRGVVYKSIDGGLHWKSVWRGANLARYILIDPKDANTLYLSTGIFDREAANSDPGADQAGGVGVLKSVDAGKTWLPVNEGLNNLYVGSLFMHPGNPEILLAGIGNNAYRPGGGVYLTVDGGLHWQHVAGDHITSVEFSSSDPNIAYAGGENQFYSSGDGGHTWQARTKPSGWGWGPDGIAPGFPIDFQVDPRNPLRIFANNYGGGNFLSEDGGKTWESASSGYTGADLLDISVRPDNPAVVYAIGRSGPFISEDGGRIWRGINPVEPESIGTGSVVEIDPQNPQVVILTDAQGGLVWKSSDDGRTWIPANDDRDELRDSTDYRDTNQKFQGFQTVAFAPSEPGVVYAGYGIWRCKSEAQTDMCRTKPIVSLLLSEDGGLNWRRLSGTPLDGLTVTKIVVHPTVPDSAWAATAGGGIFRTQDRGANWTAASRGLASKTVMDLADDPSDPEVLYAGTAANGLYKSEDGGKTWRASGAGMDANEPVGSIVIDPTRTNVIYAGSWQSGVYVSEDDGKHWRLIKDGLRTRSVRALAISSDGTTLYAATRGEGVYRLSTHDQAYFQALAPTPTPLPATATATPQTGLINKLPCGGVLILPLLAGIIRVSRRSLNPVRKYR